MKLHLRAVQSHLSYGITQCYTCYPTQVNTPLANTRFTYPG